MTIYRALIILVLFASCDASKSGPVDTSENVPLPQSAFSDLNTNKSQKVLRLTLHYKNNLFSVINSQVDSANPSPQPHAARHAPLLVQTLSENEEVLFSGGIHDPRLAQLDIEDPVRVGAWQHKEIVLNESTFPLKVPIEKGTSKLRIIDNHTTQELLKLDLTPYLDGRP